MLTSWFWEEKMHRNFIRDVYAMLVGLPSRSIINWHVLSLKKVKG